MRIFIAIRLNNDIKSHLKNITDRLSPFFEKARFSLVENYHITIKFIGETDRTGYEKIVSAVKSAAPEIEKFDINTGGPGSFRRRKRHIFYCSLKNANSLQKLHDVICIELRKKGIKADNVGFSPHITLAREVVLSDEYNGIEFESKKINVEKIAVMESTRINGKLTYIPRFTVELGGKK